MDGIRPFRDPNEDRLGPVIREHLRVLSGSAFVGLVVGGLVGGVLGRIAMRVLVITSDERLKGAITDDEAEVNKFTFSGTVGLIFFIALVGVALAWLYVGARHSLPDSTPIRAAIWAVLLWSVTGSSVFDPEGFDFTQLSPRWLAAAMFSVIFLAMGGLIAIGVERALLRWPTRWFAHAPLVVLAPGFPLYAGGFVAAFGSELNRRYRAVRIFGALVMVAIFLWLGPSTVVDVGRILF